MAKQKHYTLGVYAGVHGVSATLLEDGKPVSAIQLERLIGIKRAWVIGRKYNLNMAKQRVFHDFQDELLEFDTYFPLVINYVLDAAGITMNQIDLVALEKRNLFNSEFDSYHIDNSNELNDFFSGCRVVYVEHHQGHQAQAFFASPFDEAVVVTVDGRSWDKVERIGDFVSFTVSKGTGNRIETLFECNYSLSSTYYELSRLLFNQRYAEGKTMGLSSYSSDNDFNQPDERFWLKKEENVDYESIGIKINDKTGVIKLQVPYWDKNLTQFPGLEPLRKRDTPTLAQRQAAFLCQRYYEETLILNLHNIRSCMEIDKIALAGGPGLNSIANKKILEQTDFNQLFVFPNCGDEGLSFGFALWAYYRHLRQPRSWKMTNDYFGRTYSRREITEALQNTDGSLTVVELGDRVFEETAASISQGKVIGWFQGGSEFGPRALGNRSILAHPGIPDMKDILNDKVKHREAWRPFAPSILKEYTLDYFELDGESPYMLLVTNVRADKQSAVPAVIHVDGTARLQTVDKRESPMFYRLISEFFKQTDIPLLLNTSFNLAGKPLVETPAQALQCFLETEMDVLVMGTFFITKSKPESIEQN